MDIITIIMLTFSILGGFDRILGNRFGIGKEFERGFMLLGNMALSMIGMIVISPLIADVLEPCFTWFFEVLRIDPSIIPASIFANDMGAATLAKEIAIDERIGMFNALVVSSMMGCTISFSIPYALGVVKEAVHKELFLGMLCGIVTIPVGCFAAGLMLGIKVLMLTIDLLPLIFLSVLIAIGLMFFAELTVKIFSVVGILMKTLITIGLLLGSFQFLTGVSLVPQLADIREGAEICINAAVVLSGAFPFMHIVSKLLATPIKKIGNFLGTTEEAAMGLVGTLVTNATTFEMMNRMDRKGIILNAAFLVSAAFVFGSHLAFTMAFDATYILAVIVGKLIAGITALLLANIIYTANTDN